MSGGGVTRVAFEELVDDIVTRLAQICESCILNGLWLDIHGAMCVEGMDDGEAELFQRIRAIIGTSVVLSASMDLHGNVSPQLAHQTDLITCYRMAPHEDEMDTKERACRNLVDMLTSKTARAISPSRHYCQETRHRLGSSPPKVSTDLFPEQKLRWERLMPRSGWATRGQMNPAIMQLCWQLAGMRWSSLNRPKNWQHSFGIREKPSNLSLLQALWLSALRMHSNQTTGRFSCQTPETIPTAGGAGDVTWTLARVLARAEFHATDGPLVTYASIPGQQAAETIARPGVEATVTVVAGAEVDSVHEGPITMTGRVNAIKHGDPDASIEGILQVRNVFVVITKLRKPSQVGLYGAQPCTPGRRIL